MQTNWPVKSETRQSTSSTNVFSFIPSKYFIVIVAVLIIEIVLLEIKVENIRVFTQNVLKITSVTSQLANNAFWGIWREF